MSIRKPRMSHWQFSIRKGGIFRPGKERACPEPCEGRGCAEAYLCTPHKKPRRLTQQGRKRTLSGRKLTITPEVLLNPVQVIGSDAVALRRPCSRIALAGIEGSDFQIFLPHRVVILQFLSGAIESDVRLSHEIDAIGQGQGYPEVMFHHQDGNAGF